MPVAVTGLSSVFIRRVNRTGAVAAVLVGIGTSVILLVDSHTPGGLVPFLKHPYLTSFLHRSFVCAVISFAALMAASLLTAPPREEVLTGTFSFSWIQGEGESARDLRNAGIWMGLLFLAVSSLWWVFR